MDQKLNEERTFLAPEQIDGDNSFVDFLCDLYSLGTVVYTLLTGRPVFQSSSLEEAIPEIRSGSPTRPRKFQKSIPREFETAVMRMLCKRQEERFQTPADLLTALRPLSKAYGIDV